MANKFLWRTNQLINLLPEDCDGALIMSQINGRYFTGFNCDNGYFIVTRGDCVYVTDSRYTEAARKAIGWCEVTEYAGPKMKECFGGIAAGLGLKKLLVESDRMTLSQYRMMSDVLTPAVLSEEGELDRLIESLRVHKDSDEIVCMRAAQNIAEQTLTHLFGMIREGVTEADLAFEFEFYARRLGAERLAFDSIVASGENGSMPHAVPGQRRIRSGDFITFDVGCVVDGYHSDMTRTVAYGAICDEQRKIYDIVRRAHLQVEEADVVAVGRKGETAAKRLGVETRLRLARVKPLVVALGLDDGDAPSAVHQHVVGAERLVRKAVRLDAPRRNLVDLLLDRDRARRCPDGDPGRIPGGADGTYGDPGKAAPEERRTDPFRLWRFNGPARRRA